MRLFLILFGVLIAKLPVFSQTTIYNQDFQGGFPPGFSQITNASDGGWNTGSSNQIGSQSFPIQNQGSGTIIGTNDDDCNCNKSNDFLMTDTINLDAYTNQNVFFRFDQYYFDGSYQGDQEAASLEISTDYGNSWNVIKQLDFGAWSRESVDLTAYTGQTVMLGFRYNDGGGFLFGLALDNLLLEVPTDYSLFVDNIEVPRYFKLSNGAISIVADVFNNGGATVTSFDMNYVIDGDTVVDNITGVNITPLDAYTFSIPTAFNPVISGDYEILAFVSNVNGNANQINSNGLAESIVTVYDSAYQRIPLYEVFTSSSCGPCRPGNTNFKNVMDNYPNEYVAVKFQQDFPNAGDPYFTLESDDRRRYYGVTSIPNMQIDGGWDGSANSFNSSLHEEAYAIPTYVKIDAEYKIWPDSQKIQVCLGATSLEEYSDITLYAAILENKTTANVETNGETEFFDVFKKWFSESDTMISISSGANFETCMTYTFNGSYRLPINANDYIDHDIEHSVEEFSDLNVAVWLQENSTKEVYQAAYASKIDTSSDYTVGPNAVVIVDTTSISLIDVDQFKLALYPNPAQDELYLNYDLSETADINIKIYDQLGRAQKSIEISALNGKNTLNIRTEDLSDGIYILQVQVGNEIRSEKFLIQR